MCAFESGDLKLTHTQPVIDMALTKAYDVTWTAMEKLVETGKTKLIGRCTSFKFVQITF